MSGSTVAERTPLFAPESEVIELETVVVSADGSRSAKRGKQPVEDAVTNSPLELDLLKAVLDGDCESVKRQLHAGASPNTVDSSTKLSCAQIATRAGREDVLEALLEEGADARVTDSEKKSLLHLAVDGKHLSCLELLKTAAAGDVDHEDCRNETPLFSAVKRQWADGVQSLLDAGADITKRYGRKNSRRTVLQQAVTLDDDTRVLAAVLECVQKRGASQLLDASSPSPLLIAASRGKLAFLRMLLKAGADVTLLDKEGRSVLHCAADNAQLPTMHELFKHRPREMATLINQRSSAGRIRGLPLHLAVYQGDLECVKYLVKKNFGSVSEVADTETHKNCNVLHLSAESNKMEVTEYFMSVLCKSATASTKSTNVDDSLCQIFRRLVRETTTRGYTALHFALLRRKIGYVKVLITAGSDLTARCVDENKMARTAMDMLIYQLPSSVEMLTEFLDQSIKRSAKTTSVLVDFKILLSHLDPGGRTVCRPLCTTHSADNFGVLNALGNTGDKLGQRKLFEHPLIESFLSLHWQRLQAPYFTLVIINILFALSLSLLVLFSLPPRRRELRNPLVSIVSVFLAVLAIHEVECLTKAKKQPGAYWANFAVKLTCFGLATWALVLPDAPRACPAFAVLLAWFQVILLLSRIPRHGYYMLMFVEVAVKYLKVLGLFSFLIFGFLVAFMAIFKGNEPFDNFLPAVMKLLVMFTSELDYDDLKSSFEKLGLSNVSHILTMVIFVLFIVLIGLVLTNFLVAVAIIKIEKLHFLSHQVMFLCVYEEFLLSKCCSCMRWPTYCYGSVMLLLFDVVSAIVRPLCPKLVTKWKPFGEVKATYDIDVLVASGTLTFPQELYSAIVVKGYENRERLDRLHYKQTSRAKEVISNKPSQGS